VREGERRKVRTPPPPIPAYAPDGDVALDDDRQSLKHDRCFANISRRPN